MLVAEISIFSIVFKTLSSEVKSFKQKLSVIVKLEYRFITDSKLYLSGCFGSLVRRDYPKFKKRFSKLYRLIWCRRSKYCYVIFHRLSSIVLKFEIKVLFRIRV